MTSMRPLVRLALSSLLAGGVLSGCASAPPSTLGDRPRSVTLHHPGSGETVSVTYWRPGGYDPAALDAIAHLFRDRRTGEVLPVDPALVDLLVELRQRSGASPDAPVHITSGYRSPVTNAALARASSNVAENSYHLRGQAADIHIPGVTPRRLAEEAATLQRGGYALYAHTGHVHVDTGPVRTWTPKGGEPRGTPEILEARAAPRSKAPPKAQVAEARAVKARVAEARVAEAKPPAPVPVARAAPPAPSAPASVARAAPVPPAPDLARVRYVLMRLEEQPAPAAVRRSP